jgi:hypothetical protein
MMKEVKKSLKRAKKAKRKLSLRNLASRKMLQKSHLRREAKMEKPKRKLILKQKGKLILKQKMERQKARKMTKRSIKMRKNLDRLVKARSLRRL